MNFYVFDKSIELLGAITSYDYVTWERAFFEPANIEIQIQFDKELSNILDTDYYIYKKDTNEWAIIETIVISDEENQIVNISARGLSSILDRRICTFTNIIDVDVGTYTPIDVGALFYALIDENCINPSIEDRKISGLSMSKVNTDTIIDSKIDITNQSLLDTIKNYAEQYQIGFNMTFDIESKQMIFNTLIPEDKTENVIFSKNFGNVINQSYTKNKRDYKNVAIDNNGNVVGSGKGLERREMTGDNLDEYNVIETLETVPNQKAYPYYLQDYDIGHVVTTKNNLLDLTQTQLITKIEEGYSEKGKEIQISFGIPEPTLMEKIKRDIRKG